MTLQAAVIVIAKEPLSGRCKTRLCPPCTLAEAASLAEASLRDTLIAVDGSQAARKVVAFDGRPTHSAVAGRDIVMQRGDALDERLGNAFEDVGGPAFLVGMDTPQLTSGAIDRALRCLLRADADAVIGPTEDGGYWGIGLRRPDRRIFLSVPMSTSLTFRAQLRRLAAFGLTTLLLPRMRDIDRYEDVVAVAPTIPRSHLAATLRRLHSAEQSA